MKKGSIIAVNYTGKVVTTNQVFESTIEKKAVEGGIFSEKTKYVPLIVVVDEGDVLPGLDRALLEMKVGEERKVSVKPEEGWGERKPANIAVVPLQQFKQKKIQPFPGLIVDVNGQQGKVQSVSGGRVRVDFNHPLAGKDLEYEVRVEKEISQPKEQIDVLYNKYFSMVPKEEKSLVVGKAEVEVTLSPRWSANLGPLKQIFSKIVTTHVKGFEKVRFVEEFKEEKKPAEAKKEESKTGEKEAKKAEKKEEKKA